MSKKILIATHNQHKLQEIRAILQGFPVELCSMDEFPNVKEAEENGNSYEENAIIKAKYASLATGLSCLGDDTGLEVDALQGAPGLHSARFAGVTGEGRYPANNEKLLRLLKDLPKEKRTAQFVCTVAWVYQDQVWMICRGVCHGTILFERQGTRGFGYDCLFEVQGMHQAFAELPDQLKNSISHRALAFQEFHRRFMAENWLLKMK